MVAYQPNKIVGFIELANLASTTPSQSFTVPPGQVFVGSLSTSGPVGSGGNNYCILTKTGNTCLTSPTVYNTAGATANVSSAISQVILQGGVYTLAAFAGYASATGGVYIQGALYER